VLQLFKRSAVVDLAQVIRTIVIPSDGFYKCRVLYNASDFLVTIEAFTPKVISSLRCCEAPDLVYDLKYANREALNALFAQRGDCADVLITQNGWLRDTSYGNICLLQGNTWFTPVQPLLRGTMREVLLQQGRIQLLPIHKNDLSGFSHFRVINAFRGELIVDGSVAEIG
jgi:4-amino-4-deoxychorismate lyase